MNEPATIFRAIQKIVSDSTKWTRGEQLGGYSAIRWLLVDLQNHAKDNPPKDSLYAMSKLGTLQSDLNIWFQLDDDGGFSSKEYSRRVSAGVEAVIAGWFGAAGLPPEEDELPAI